MPSTNSVIVSGRLTRDPELKYLASGMAICNFSIANGRPYKDKSGEWTEETSFIDVTCWDKTATHVGEKIKKGRPVMVEGRLKSESWEDKQTGAKRSKLGIVAHSVIVLDWDEKGDKPESRRESKPQQSSEPPIGDDDIPF
jgi:single-strand DNA-binding protein